MLFLSDGEWTSWTTWSACPVECNGGLITRTRSCDNPSPSNFGKSCVGSDKDVTLCNNHPCIGKTSLYLFISLFFKMIKNASFEKVSCYMNGENLKPGFEPVTLR